MSTIRLIVYDPPEDGYPFLAVALSPTREVFAVAYDTRQEAEAHNAALATEAARAKPSENASRARRSPLVRDRSAGEAAGLLP
jgi:hypothetical protein